MLGQRIKELRKKRKMTQYDLAQLLGISSSAIGMYEQDRRDPNYELILKISEIFEVTVDYLLSNDDTEVCAELVYKTKSKKNDLSDMVKQFKEQIMQQQGLMFKGEALTDDDIMKVFSAMEVGMEIALKTSKE